MSDNEQEVREEVGEEEMGGEVDKEKSLRRVFVTNLPYQTSWQDLKDRFAEIGTVEFANIFKSFNGRSKGCGIVEFSSVEDAEKAIKEVNETDFEGRTIYVKPDSPPEGGRRGRGRGFRRGRGRGFRGGRGFRRGRGRGGFRGPRREFEGEPSGKSVFIGNLSFDVEVDTLRAEMEKYGKVVDCNIPVGYSGRKKGFATCEFEAEEEATACIEKLDGTEFEGRTINVRLDRQK